MDTCQFTYISNQDVIRTAVGVEQSWDVLCQKLNRTGTGLPGGLHYFTISFEGPDLFAVRTDDEIVHVYYQKLDGDWTRYITARDIKFAIIPDTNPGEALTRATSPN